MRFTILYYRAEKKEEQAREFIAGALWVLIISSVLLTIAVFFLNSRLLRLLGASGELLALEEEYIAVIALGAFMQVIGMGLVPFIRNHGGSFYAMVSDLVEYSFSEDFVSIFSCYLKE